MIAQKYVFQKHSAPERKLRGEICIVINTTERKQGSVRVPVGYGLSNLRIESCQCFLQFQVLIIFKLYFSITEKYNEDCC